MNAVFEESLLTGQTISLARHVTTRDCHIDGGNAAQAEVQGCGLAAGMFTYIGKSKRINAGGHSQNTGLWLKEEFFNDDIQKRLREH